MDTIYIEIPVIKMPNMTQDQAVSAMMIGLKKLIEIGALKGNLDDILLDYNINNRTGSAIAIVSKSALVDASKLQLNGTTLTYPLDTDALTKDFQLSDKSFSVATINERLRVSKLDPKAKFRFIIKDYSKYYQSNKSKLLKDVNSVRKLKDMFLVDMMGLFTEILPSISEGKQLATLTGLNTVTKGLLNTSRDLSLAYKKALKQTKTGAISKTNFTNLQKYYANFMNLLVPQVFPGIDKLNLNGTRSFSSDEQTISCIKIGTEDPVNWTSLFKSVKSTDKPIKISVRDYDDDSIINEVAFKSGMNSIISISSTTISSKVYSYLDDGRINLAEE